MSNQYYILKPAVDTKVTGNVFPAVESYNDYDFNGPNSVHKLNHHEFPSFEPNIRLKLVNGAILCDVLGQATINASGLLVSERLKNALSQLIIVPHTYYPASIEDTDGAIHKYYWMHLVWQENDKLVNFRDSIFYQKRGARELGELNIQSQSDYQYVKEKIGSRFMIGQKKLVLNYFPNYDIWLIPYSPSLIIHERIKPFFEKFTGISLIQDNKIIIPGPIS